MRVCLSVLCPLNTHPTLFPDCHGCKGPRWQNELVLPAFSSLAGTVKSYGDFRFLHIEIPTLKQLDIVRLYQKLTVKPNFRHGTLLQIHSVQNPSQPY